MGRVCFKSCNAWSIQGLALTSIFVSISNQSFTLNYNLLWSILSRKRQNLQRSLLQLWAPHWHAQASHGARHTVHGGPGLLHNIHNILSYQVGFNQLYKCFKWQIDIKYLSLAVLYLTIHLNIHERYKQSILLKINQFNH